MNYSSSMSEIKEPIFSELQCTSILTEEARKSLDRWQALNDEQRYYDLVKRSLCSLFAFTKNAYQTTYKNSYLKYGKSQLYDSNKARFDKLINTISKI